ARRTRRRTPLVHRRQSVRPNLAIRRASNEIELVQVSSEHDERGEDPPRYNAPFVRLPFPYVAQHGLLRPRAHQIDDIACAQILGFVLDAKGSGGLSPPATPRWQIGEIYFFGGGRGQKQRRRLLRLSD